MSSFLCFVCHSTVNADTNEETRDKYREVIGMNLCPDSHICFICCHFLNKMWLFKSICLKRSLEYPVLFSEKGTINLQRSDTQVGILCTEDMCLQHRNTKYHFFNTVENTPTFDESKYLQLHEVMHFGLLPNNVEVQTDDIFDQFNVNLLKTADEHFNNDFLVNIRHDNINTRKDVDEFIFGNDSIESPLENINKIELANLDEISEVNITLTDLNVRNFEKLQELNVKNDLNNKNYENDFVGKSQDCMRNNSFVEQTHEVRNNDYADSSHVVMRHNDFVARPNEYARNNHDNFVERTNENVTDNHFVNQPHNITRNNEFVESSHHYCERNNDFVTKPQEYHEKSQLDLESIRKSPELVKNVDYIETVSNSHNDFIENKTINENDSNVINSHDSNNSDTELNDSINAHEESYDTSTDGDNDTELNNIASNENNTEQIDESNDINKYHTKMIYNKITLSLEDQKRELEENRKDKKYIDAVFKCRRCALGFLFKDTYQAHMMRHEESNGEHRCSICTLRFANSAVLRSHRANHAVRYQCTICEQIVKSSHRQTHACYGDQGVRRTCHLCGKVFPGASHYQQHLKRVHHKKQSRTYLCSVCGKSFGDQAAVRTHMLTHVNRKFTCDVCQSTFSSPYTLNNHRRKHETVKTELHFCVTCNIGYTSRKSLLAHQRNALVHKERVYKCPVCDRTCPTLSALHNHTSAVHARSKDMFCAICPASYSTRKGLVKHMRSHKNVEPKLLPLCHACGETFKSTSILKRHLKNVCEKDKHEEELSNYYEQ